MIEKFNLYDVYGYFLPGLALIAVLWFPFGVVTHSWPRGDWASAITAVALSYFVGHLMLYVSTKVLPSDDVTKSGDHLRRKYSATVLDGDSDLPTSLREKIASAVTREFDMHMHPEDSTGQYDNDRNAAFELARQRLILD